MIDFLPELTIKEAAYLSRCPRLVIQARGWHADEDERALLSRLQAQQLVRVRLMAQGDHCDGTKAEVTLTELGGVTLRAWQRQNPHVKLAAGNITWRGMH